MKGKPGTKGPSVPDLKRRVLMLSRDYRHLVESVQADALTRAGLSSDELEYAMQPLRSFHAMCDDNDLEWLGVTQQEAERWGPKPNDGGGE